MVSESKCANAFIITVDKQFDVRINYALTNMNDIFGESEKRANPQEAHI